MDSMSAATCRVTPCRRSAGGGSSTEAPRPDLGLFAVLANYKAFAATTSLCKRRAAALGTDPFSRVLRGAHPALQQRL